MGNPSKFHLFDNVMSLKLKETDLIANSINSPKTLSGKEGTDVNGFRYRKSAQIEITSSNVVYLCVCVCIYIYIYI